METLIVSEQLIKDIVRSETEYMHDRMAAIQSRSGNPEGIEMRTIGNALCLYSKTMPWLSFNTVKGITNDDIGHIRPIIEFYKAKERKAQFEVVPSFANDKLLQSLSAHGCYPSGFHTSLYIDPASMKAADNNYDESGSRIRIEELQEDQFERYAKIHCRGTGLSDDGIPYVMQNNKVLYHRPGWKFFIAYWQDSPAAVGVMYMKDGVASLTLAATLPEFRNQGLQQSLLRRRIEEAGNNYCRLAVSQCSFLSQSHRNMERVGMKIGYVRTSWTMPDL